MGEVVTQFALGFNKSVRIEARQERITSETGALLARDVLETLGVLSFLDKHLEDRRNPTQITHPLREMVATAVLLKVLGWRDQDDADALRDDSAMRLSVSNRRGVGALLTREPSKRDKDNNLKLPDGLASQPTLSRMLGTLSSEGNREVLRDALIAMVGERIRKERRGHRIRHMALDIDSLPIAVEGHQPGSEYNGHYHERVFHPLVASIAETGDIVDAQLRPGNVHTAQGALDFILPLVDKLEQSVCQVASIRMDAGFPEEKLLNGLESRAIPYVARVKNNKRLDTMAAPYLLPPDSSVFTDGADTWVHELTYQAQSWSRPRRVVLVTQRREGELFLHHFWLITNWSAEQLSGEALLQLYRQRGTAESIMGELMDVLDPALSSCSRQKSHYRNAAPLTRYPAGDSFAINEALLLLNLLAYETMHALRLLIQKATHDAWSIKRLRERVLHVGARVLVHARAVTVVLERRAIRYWAPLLRQLQRLLGPVPAS